MNVLSSFDLTANGAPLLRTGVDEDEEFLLASFTNVKIYNSSSNIQDDDIETQLLPHVGSTGTLFVTTSRVIWLGASVEQYVGCAWEMGSLTLHAISRDPEAFPSPCLYCQISDQEDVSEVRFVPENDKTLQEMFDAFSKSAEMNPDEDDDDDDGWICDEEEIADGARAAQLAAHFDSMLQVSPEFESSATELGQFDDADEDSLL